MKLFKDYQQFAFTTIRENLTIARYAITTPKVKDSDSCYGMPAIVLLASVIDIIGTFYRSGSFEAITTAEIKADGKLGAVNTHFEQFYSKFLTGKCDRDLFMDSFYRLSRCRTTHNGVLGPNIVITKNKSTDGEFIKKKRRLTHIFLNELYDMVNAAFESMVSDSKLEIAKEIIGPSTGRTYN